jgi:hypothetical protein
VCHAGTERERARESFIRNYPYRARGVWRRPRTDSASPCLRSTSPNKLGGCVLVLDSASLPLLESASRYQIRGACGPGTSNTGCTMCRHLKYGVYVVPEPKIRGACGAGTSNTGCTRCRRLKYGVHVIPTAQIRGACGTGGPLIILRSICSVGYLHARGVRRERKRVERERESRERVERERRRERDPGRAACLLV